MEIYQPQPAPIRRSRLSEAEWRELRPIIEKLYKSQNKTRKEVCDHLLHEHKVMITENVFKKRIAKWKLDKKRKRNEMLFAEQKVFQRRMLGKETDIHIRGEYVTEGDITSYFSRHPITAKERFLIPEDLLTPSDVSYGTPDADLLEDDTNETINVTQDDVSILVEQSLTFVNTDGTTLVQDELQSIASWFPEEMVTPDDLAAEDQIHEGHLIQLGPVNFNLLSDFSQSFQMFSGIGVNRWMVTSTRTVVSIMICLIEDIFGIKQPVNDLSERRIHAIANGCRLRALLLMSPIDMLCLLAVQLIDEHLMMAQSSHLGPGRSSFLNVRICPHCRAPPGHGCYNDCYSLTSGITLFHPLFRALRDLTTSPVMGLFDTILSITMPFMEKATPHSDFEIYTFRVLTAGLAYRKIRCMPYIITAKCIPHYRSHMCESCKHTLTEHPFTSAPLLKHAIRRMVNLIFNSFEKQPEILWGPPIERSFQFQVRERSKGMNCRDTLEIAADMLAHKMAQALEQVLLTVREGHICDVFDRAFDEAFTWPRCHCVTFGCEARWRPREWWHQEFLRNSEQGFRSWATGLLCCL